MTYSPADHDRDDSAGRFARHLAAFARLAGLAVACAGGVFFAAAALARPGGGGLPALDADTSLSLLCSGLALRLFCPGRISRFASWAGHGCAASVLLFGAVSLARSLALPGSPADAAPAPAAALGLACVGAALVLLGARRLLVLTQALALAVLGVSSLILIALVYQVSSPDARVFGPASPVTAASFLLLGAGILTVEPRRGVLAVVTADGAGGAVARRLLPAAVGVPVVAGWLRLEGQRAGWYGTEFGLTLFALANVAGFSALVLWSAARLRRTDAARDATVAALRESEARFRHLADALPQIVWTTDQGGRSTYLNNRWAEYTGLPDASPENAGRVIHPDDQPPMDAAWGEAHRSGRGFQAEFRLRPAAGGPYRWFLARAVAVRRPGGGVGEWLGTSTDIDDLKRAEEALRESEARFHRTFDNMLEGCQIIGFDWRYLYVNDSIVAHARRTREELVGRTMTEVYPGFETTEVYGHLRRCMDGRTPVRVENRFVYPDGHAAWFDLSVQPGPEGIFVLSADITDRKEAEEKVLRLNAELEERVRARTAELEAANKELEAFSYSVSHDLRAPLRAIDGFSRIVQEDFGPQLPAGRPRTTCDDVRANTRQMGRLVDDLLAFSRLGRKPVAAAAGRHRRPRRRVPGGAAAGRRGPAGGRPGRRTSPTARPTRRCSSRSG